jgi:hypothetical protein
MVNSKKINRLVYFAIALAVLIIVGTVYSVLPNPGHLASEVGGNNDADRTFNGTIAENYTFPTGLKVSGNLGVGTNNPTQKLDVQGNANISGSIYLGNTKCADGEVLRTNTTTGLVNCVLLSSIVQGSIRQLNFSTQTYNGSIAYNGLIGYRAANAICNNNFTGTFFCSEFDVADFVRNNNVSDNVDAWVIAGGPKYIPATIPVDDCNGFIYDAIGLHVANYWKYNSTNGGAGKAINCQTKIPLSCCK